jgi:hypothetical protein
MTESSAHRASTKFQIGAPTYLSFSRQVVLGMLVAAGVGGVAAIGGSLLYSNGGQRIVLAYLVALAFVLSISLGSLFFVLIQHLTRAGWAVLIRRPAEVFAINVITVGVLALPVALSAFTGARSIYPWARGDASSSTTEQHSSLLQNHSASTVSAQPVAFQAGAPAASHSEDPAHTESPTATHEDHDPRSHLYVHQTFDSLTASKTVWLNPGFFLLRLLVYFLLWGAMARFYFRHSRNQDERGGVVDTLRMEKWAGPCIFAFGLSLTFASFDLLMSLDPHWYSTIFGVYYFAGCAVGGFSISLLTWLVLSRLKKVPVTLSDEHYRDLGRLLFAFVFFWGYIAFSQYMLLWYANVPETTRWWAVRGASLADGFHSSWGIVLVLLLFGHFVIPFFGIMSRHVKGNRNAMIFWTIWMLVMHYVDLYWLVMPEFRGSITFGLPELGTLLLVGSLYALGASYFATRTALVPVGDPRLKASLAIVDAY